MGEPARSEAPAYTELTRGETVSAVHVGKRLPEDALTVHQRTHGGGECEWGMWRSLDQSADWNAHAARNPSSVECAASETGPQCTRELTWQRDHVTVKEVGLPGATPAAPEDAWGALRVFSVGRWLHPQSPHCTRGLLGRSPQGRVWKTFLQKLNLQMGQGAQRRKRR